MKTSEQSTLPSLKNGLLVAVTFFAIALACFAPALRGDFLTWDDTLLVSENENLATTNLQTLKTDFTSYDPELYIPLTFASYRIDMLLGGSPTVFHIHNLILHVINALLIAWLLWLLLGSEWIAALFGLIFLLHPLNTEAAVWISARKDVLSTAFFFGSLISYVLSTRIQSRKIFLLSLVLFCFGLLSKVMVITLPFVLMMIDWLEGRRIDRWSIVSKLPYFALAGIFGIIALFGKSQLLVASTPVEKILMAGKSTWFYLTAFVWPHPLSVMYPYTQAITLRSPDFLVPLVAIASIGVCIALVARRWKFIALGAAFFAISVAPTFLNFAKGGDIYFASDRYAYIPMFGLLFVAAAAVQRFLQNAEYHQQSKRLLVSAASCAGIAFVFFFLTNAQSATWATSQALYAQALSVYPNSHAARTNIGMVYLDQGEYDKAEQEFIAALAIRENPYTRIDLASAYVRKGLPDVAIAEYNKVLASANHIPDAHYGLATVLHAQGKMPEAEAEYKKTIELDPAHASAYNNLGGLLLTQERWKEAADALQKAVELQPDFPEALLNLANAKDQSGDKPGAIVALQQALVLLPKDTHVLTELAWLYYETGDTQKAMNTVHTSLLLDTDSPRSIELVERMKKDGVGRK